MLEEIKELSDQVLIAIWDDGHESLYFADHLRKNCPCAMCSNEEEQPEEKNLFKKLGNPGTLDTISFAGWKMVGRYAVSFRFSDGHNAGIYPYALLRKLCQCDLCTGHSVRIQGPFKP